jgi:hypothetical protein
MAVEPVCGLVFAIKLRADWLLSVVEASKSMLSQAGGHSRQGGDCSVHNTCRYTDTLLIDYRDALKISLNKELPPIPMTSPQSTTPPSVSTDATPQNVPGMDNI